MDLWHFDQAKKNSFSSFFVIYYIPNINKMRSIVDSSVLIIQSYNSDLSETTNRTFFLC